jgi:hypothetical protein
MSGLTRPGELDWDKLSWTTAGSGVSFGARVEQEVEKFHGNGGATTRKGCGKARFVVQWRFVSFSIMIPPGCKRPLHGIYGGPRVILKRSKSTTRHC